MTVTASSQSATSLLNRSNAACSDSHPYRKILIYYVEKDRLDDISQQFEFPKPFTSLNPKTSKLLTSKHCSWLVPLTTQNTETLITHSADLPGTVTVEDLIFSCAKIARIIPSQINFFGLYSNIHGYFLPPRHIFSDHDDINCEFRVRFVLGCDTQGHTAQRLCLHDADQAIDGEAYRYGFEVMFTKESMTYYFHQIRKQIITQKLILKTDSNEHIEQSLGFAILDLFRISCDEFTQKPSDLVASKVIKLKHLLPTSVVNKINSKNVINTHRIKSKFNKTVVTTQNSLQNENFNPNRPCSRDNAWTDFAMEYFMLKYTQNISLIISDFGVEKFDLTFEEMNENNESKTLNAVVEVDGDSGISISQGKLEKNHFVDFDNISNIHVKKTTKNDETYVTICTTMGHQRTFKFKDSNTAYSFTSVVDGYYRLLVDSHFYFIEECCPFYIQDLVDAKVYGPITRSFAENVLNNASPGSCIIRANPETTNEFFITTKTKHDRRFCNYRINHISKQDLSENIEQDNTELANIIAEFKAEYNTSFHGVGFFGRDDAPRFESLSDFLRYYRDQGHLLPGLPFDVKHMITPIVKEDTSQKIFRFKRIKYWVRFLKFYNW